MKSHVLLKDEKTRSELLRFIQAIPLNSVIEIETSPTRTLSQNAAQWPILQAFSKQLPWLVNGKLTTLISHEYKEILTCAFEHEVYPRLAHGFEEGLVMLGHRTRHYSKDKFSQWLEFLHHCAAVKNIQL